MRNALRLNLTNACQYDCFYCLQKKRKPNSEQIPRELLIPFCRTAVQNGICRVELAGGEPLLYENITELVKEIKAIQGVEWVSMTTNGILLSKYLPALIDAGLDGVNLHLDTTLAYPFREITGVEKKLNEILQGLWEAVARDLPVTVTVALHSLSVQNAALMAGLARKLPIQVRFADIGAEIESNDSETDDKLVLQNLQKSIGKVKTEDNEVFYIEGWKGTFVFGHGISGAFDMEHALEIRME